MYVVLEPDLVNNSYSKFVCTLDEPLVFTCPHEVALAEFFYSANIDFVVGSLSVIRIFDEQIESINTDFENLVNEFVVASNQGPEKLANQLLAELDVISNNYMDLIDSNISDQAFKKFQAFYARKFSVSDRFKNNFDQILDNVYSKYLKCQNKIKLLVDVIVKDRCKNNVVVLDGIYENEHFTPGYNIQEIKSTFFDITNSKFRFKTNNFTSYYTIYTNIIESSIVKNQPVLRTIKPEGEHGDYIEKVFDRPQYIPCNRTFINKISIDILDNYLNPVQFRSGPLILKLHFRKSKK